MRWLSDWEAIWKTSLKYNTDKKHNLASEWLTMCENWKDMKLYYCKWQPSNSQNGYTKIRIPNIKQRILVKR